MESLEDPRHQLLRSLRGQTLVIPDLQALFSHWPHAISPEVERVREDVDRRLEMLFPNNSERLCKLKKSQFAEFAASLWPYAPYEALRIATSSIVWVFLWDDGRNVTKSQRALDLNDVGTETDSHEYSSLVNHFDEAIEYRRTTGKCIRKYLAVGSEFAESRVAPDAIIASFEPVGRAISESCTPAQTNALLKGLILFIDKTHVEHQFQYSGHLPSVEEYLDHRMGTSAVKVVLPLIEYCYEMEEIPASVKEASGMKTLWDALWYQTNLNISIANDIFSFKKEFAQDQVDSLIPLLYLREGSIQGAMDCAVEMFRSSIQNLDSVSTQLLALNESDVNLSERLQKFINGCKYVCTGNTSWSLQTGRYNINRESTQNGLSLTL